MIAARFLSTVWSWRIASELTTLTPASIRVANWREKICSALGSTFLNRPERVDELLARRVEALREQAPLAEQVARRLEIGRVQLALELDALRVDRRVVEGRHR